MRLLVQLIGEIMGCSLSGRCTHLSLPSLLSISPFLQAYLLKNDENKGLAPAALQQELNNMLKFNPDFTEAVRLCGEVEEKETTHH